MKAARLLAMGALGASGCLFGCRTKPAATPPSGVREAMARRMCDAIATELIRGRSDQFYSEMAAEYRAVMTPAQHRAAMAKNLSVAGHVQRARMVHSEAGVMWAGIPPVMMKTFKYWYVLEPHQPGGYYATVAVNEANLQVVQVAVVRFTQGEPF